MSPMVTSAGMIISFVCIQFYLGTSFMINSRSRSSFYTHKSSELYSCGGESSIADNSRSSLLKFAGAFTAVSALTTVASVTSVLADEPKKKKLKVKETDLGIKYLELKQGSGAYPQDGDIVAFTYRYMKNIAK